jgi:putative ABC transport system permease protein
MTRAELAMIWRLFRHDAARQRKRIALTVLAIAWGTVTLVLLLSFGEGLKRQLRKGTRGMGEGIGVVWAGSTSKTFAGLPSGRKIAFVQSDGELLRARIPEIAAISAEYERWQTPLTVGRKTITARLAGVEPAYGDMRNSIPQPGGRFLNEHDYEDKRRVIFLGNKTSDDLFGKGANPVGRELKVKDTTFLVIGVLQKKIQTQMYSGPDAEQVMIPATTFLATFGATQRPANFVYKPRTPEQGDAAEAQVYTVLAGRYHFDPTDRPALRVWDTRVTQRLNDNIVVGVEIFFGIIGSLTILIGGMGVANVMYALVKERTREIGLEMALGAKVRHVMMPFVLEALFMTVLGGIVGTAVSLVIVVGVSSLQIDSDAMEFLAHPTFSPIVAASTSVVIGVIGLFAGYLPARRAAAIQPAVSLRYE